MYYADYLGRILVSASVCGAWAVVVFVESESGLKLDENISGSILDIQLGLPP